jgi:cytoskeletal protein CcmA (bactofilin family)
MESKPTDQSKPEQSPGAQSPPKGAPAATSTPPPASGGGGSAPKNDGKPAEGATKVIKADPNQQSSWQTHSFNTDGSGKPLGPPKKGWWHNHLLVGGIAAAAILLVAGGALLFIRQKATPAAINKDTSIDLQNVGENILKGINTIAGNDSKQTLNISANSVFQNAATVEKTLNVKGTIEAQDAVNVYRDLNVAGAANLNTLNLRSNATVAGTTALQGNVEAKNQLTVRGALNVTNSAIITGNLNVSGNIITPGTITAQKLNVVDLAYSGTFTIIGHITSAGSNPTVAANVAAGGGSARTDGNDTAGTVVITTGGSPIAGQMATITFKKPYGSTPKVLLSPVGSTSAHIEYYSTRTTTYFTINCGVAPLPNNTYTYDYMIIE